MKAPAIPHQYIDRRSRRVVTERLVADPLIRSLYSRARESAPLVFRAAISNRMSGLLGYLNYDGPLASVARQRAGRIRAMGIDPSECLEPPEALDTVRKLFERKIRYWRCRPMHDAVDRIVSPADARMIVGSLHGHSPLFLKEKFFSFFELIGTDKQQWIDAFHGGDFAIFRLTPDKYHYNHTPVSGRVLDFYEIHGHCHSCNPGAVVTEVTPFSKNRRVVTVIDTDIPGGSGVGLVAMIEIVAMMIGEIVQCYSVRAYDGPMAIRSGLFLERGRPKSLYRPGSSVDVVIFQRQRVTFSADILANMARRDVSSRFTHGFYTPLVETDVRVRSEIGRRAVRSKPDARDIAEA